jgi:hypothetical protein
MPINRLSHQSINVTDQIQRSDQSLKPKPYIRSEPQIKAKDLIKVRDQNQRSDQSQTSSTATDHRLDNIEEGNPIQVGGSPSLRAQEMLWKPAIDAIFRIFPNKERSRSHVSRIFIM